MRSIILLSTGLVIGTISGLVLAKVPNPFIQPYHPVEEAKICYVNLTKYSSSLDPQLREYLKARLYSTASNSISEGWLDGWKIDFGTVDDSVLQPVYAIKDASPTNEVYEAALAKHPRSAHTYQVAEQDAAPNH
jgi:hypothetical protein